MPQHNSQLFVVYNLSHLANMIKSMKCLRTTLRMGRVIIGSDRPPRQPLNSVHDSRSLRAQPLALWLMLCSGVHNMSGATLPSKCFVPSQHDRNKPLCNVDPPLVLKPLCNMENIAKPLCNMDDVSPLLSATLQFVAKHRWTGL